MGRVGVRAGRRVHPLRQCPERAVRHLEPRARILARAAHPVDLAVSRLARARRAHADAVRGLVARSGAGAARGAAVGGSRAQHHLRHRAVRLPRSALRAGAGARRRASVPPSAFFANTLSLRLQLLSSAIGVDVIRLFGISVYLDGNVIDLGTYKLQVAEACNGLRYLYPLMTLAFVVAYLFRAAAWKRVLLFLASIPIAVLMNSLRIGLIGVTVEHWGVKMAEGVLHDFEGWVVFMFSLIVLLLLAAVLVRIGEPHARLRDALMLDAGRAPARTAVARPRELPLPFLAATALAALATVLNFAMPERAELRPARLSFAEFPLQLAAWQGERGALEPVYLDELKLDDYLLADYRGAAGMPVNVWIAYYDSQRKGQSTHSPRSCLPGGGWEFVSLGTQRLDTSAGMLTVNRAVIEHGADRQLVYYWFQQRGRVLTNEYLVKWYILVDALTRNRTDGALVRLITPLAPGSSAAAADRDLTRFAGLLKSELRQYVPN